MPVTADALTIEMLSILQSYAPLVWYDLDLVRPGKDTEWLALDQLIRGGMAAARIHVMVHGYTQRYVVSGEWELFVADRLRLVDQMESQFLYRTGYLSFRLTKWGEELGELINRARGERRGCYAEDEIPGLHQEVSGDTPRCYFVPSDDALVDEVATCRQRLKKSAVFDPFFAGCANSDQEMLESRCGTYLRPFRSPCDPYKYTRRMAEDDEAIYAKWAAAAEQGDEYQDEDAAAPPADPQPPALRDEPNTETTAPSKATDTDPDAIAKIPYNAPKVLATLVKLRAFDDSTRVSRRQSVRAAFNKSADPKNYGKLFGAMVHAGLIDTDSRGSFITMTGREYLMRHPLPPEDSTDSTGGNGDTASESKSVDHTEPAAGGGSSDSIPPEDSSPA